MLAREAGAKPGTNATIDDDDDDDDDEQLFDILVVSARTNLARVGFVIRSSRNQFGCVARLDSELAAAQKERAKADACMRVEFESAPPPCFFPLACLKRAVC